MIQRIKYRLINWRARHEGLSRRVATENVLFSYVEKGAQPTTQDCRIMALRLGTPKELWSDVVKNHKWSKDND